MEQEKIVSGMVTWKTRRFGWMGQLDVRYTESTGAQFRLLKTAQVVGVFIVNKERKTIEFLLAKVTF